MDLFMQIDWLIRPVKRGCVAVSTVCTVALGAVCKPTSEVDLCRGMMIKLENLMNISYAKQE